MLCLDFVDDYGQLFRMWNELIMFGFSWNVKWLFECTLFCLDLARTIVWNKKTMWVYLILFGFGKEHFLECEFTMWVYLICLDLGRTIVWKTMWVYHIVFGFSNDHCLECEMTLRVYHIVFGFGKDHSLECEWPWTIVRDMKWPCEYKGGSWNVKWPCECKGGMWNGRVSVMELIVFGFGKDHCLEWNVK